MSKDFLAQNWLLSLHHFIVYPHSNNTTKPSTKNSVAKIFIKIVSKKIIVDVTKCMLVEETPIHTTQYNQTAIIVILPNTVRMDASSSADASSWIYWAAIIRSYIESSISQYVSSWNTHDSKDQLVSVWLYCVVWMGVSSTSIHFVTSTMLFFDIILINIFATEFLVEGLVVLFEWGYTIKWCKLNNQFCARKSFDTFEFHTSLKLWKRSCNLSIRISWHS